MSGSKPNKLYHLSIDPNLNKLSPRVVQVSREEGKEDMSICACPDWWMCVHLLPPHRHRVINSSDPDSNLKDPLYVYEVVDVEKFEPLPEGFHGGTVVEYRTESDVTVRLLGRLKKEAYDSVSLNICKSCRNPIRGCQPGACASFLSIVNAIDPL